ncbi:hypothetical protein V2J09_009715 [Rumex salicifolius]
MQAISRWRNLLNLRSTAAFSVTQSSSFHSTAACNERSNKKWNHDFSRSKQRPAKNQIRFVTHEKRDDAKKALKNLLFNTGAFENAYQHERRSSKKLNQKNSFQAELGHDSDSSASTRKRRSKTCPVERAKSKLKRKLRRGYLSEDDERREAAFKAAFGNKSASWNFTSFDGSSFQNSKFGFEWVNDSDSNNNRNKKWEADSDIDSDDEEDVGSHLDRTTLGLPPSGPLKMEDVKNAFRLSALKWHPDKHQGCSQAEAEEKFKLCVDSYRSLCNAISAA